MNNLCLTSTILYRVGRTFILIYIISNVHAVRVRLILKSKKNTENERERETSNKIGKSKVGPVTAMAQPSIACGRLWYLTSNC